MHIQHLWVQAELIRRGPKGTSNQGLCEPEHDYHIVRLLKVCTATKNLHEGSKLHEYVQKHNCLVKNIYIGNTLVSMYAKCGALAKAHQVLTELPVRDVVSWNALIAGHSQQGQGEEALKCYDDMLHEGHRPDAVTFACVLKACGSIGATAKGEEIHDRVATFGMLEKDVMLGATLVDMYAKCNELAKARMVLKELPMRNVVSWTTLIAAHAQQGQGEEALKCFDDMVQEGHSPNAVTFVCVLKACGIIGAAAKGKVIHDKIVTLAMLEKDLVLGISLLDMYAKCGDLVKAHKVHKDLPVRNLVSWTALIAGYARQGQGKEALKYFDDMLCEGHCPNAVTFICVLKACGSIGAAAKGKDVHDLIVDLGLLEKDVVLGITLVDMYAKCGDLAKAYLVLKALPIRDVVSWTTLIAGHAQQGQGEEALNCFNDMIYEGHSPNAVTFACVLKACGSIGATAKGEEIHDKIVSLGMLEKNVVLQNALVDMYVKCGQVAKAHQVLKGLTMHDVFSWNAIIVGLVQEANGEEALKCFDDMQCEGHSPNAATFACALKACGSIGATAKGEAIHDRVVILGMLKRDVVLGATLVDMYAKCGELAKAQKVFEELPICDIVCWNALIGGYAQQGEIVEAISCFEEMQSSGVMPDLISMTTVLNACSHSGLLDQAETYFSGMSEKYGMHPSLEHYCCMVDVFGRAGKFNKALSVISEMPNDKCLSGWVALLGTCRKWAEVKIGILAFKCAFKLDKFNASIYVLMVEIYTAAGKQEAAHTVEVMRGK